MSLETQIDKLFVKERHGIVTKAVLKEVRKKKVVLQGDGRQDKFTLPLAEFKKHYVLGN